MSASAQMSKSIKVDFKEFKLKNGLRVLLVEDHTAWCGVFAFVNGMRGNGDYQITATVALGKKIEDVEAAINEEISRIQREPIADWELAKAKNSSRRSSIQSLQGSLGIATRLSQFAVFYNDPNLINSQLQKIAAVTKEDVQESTSI